MWNWCCPSHRFGIAIRRTASEWQRGKHEQTFHHRIRSGYFASSLCYPHRQPQGHHWRIDNAMQGSHCRPVFEAGEDDAGVERRDRSEISPNRQIAGRNPCRKFRNTPENFFFHRYWSPPERSRTGLLRDPHLRHTSFTGAPSPACRRTKAIHSSENLGFFALRPSSSSAEIVLENWHII